MGRLDFGSFYESTDRPGFVTGVFTMLRRCCRKRNSAGGSARWNLSAKTVETPSRWVRRRLGGDVSFTISPDRSRALRAALSKSAANELWTIDIGLSHRVLSRVASALAPAHAGPRQLESASLLYFYEAGRLIRRCTRPMPRSACGPSTLDSDMMYGTFVIVPGR